MDTLSDDKLRETFDTSFRTYRDQDWAVEWRTRYVAHVERVRHADRSAWLDPTFQGMLWDENPVSNIGPGTSVTVTGAYTDQDLAARLLEIRDAGARGDIATRGKTLQE